MDKLHNKNQALRYLLIAASIVVLVAAFKVASAIFIPVLLAFFIATVSFPITDFLRKHRMPRFLAVLLTVLVDFAFLTGVILIFVSMAGDFQEKWEGPNGDGKGGYQEKVGEKISSVERMVSRLAENLDLKGLSATDDDKELSKEVLNAERRGDRNYADKTNDEKKSYFINLAFDQIRGDKIGKFVTGSLNVAGQVATFFSTIFIVVVLTIFMLTEARMFGRRLAAISEAKGPNFQRMMAAAQDIQRYMGIKTLVSLITGFLAGLLCWFAGLDFYVLWGILAFVLNYIPVVGSILAGIPAVLLAFLVLGMPSAVAIAIGYGVINVLLGNLIEPMLLGHRFGISTLVVVLAVLFWGWVWGPVGMLLAVPLTMILKVVLDNTEDLRWLSVAIGKERPSENLEEMEALEIPPAKEGGGIAASS